MGFIIRNKGNDIPQGFHKPENDFIMDNYFSYDKNGDCNVSKNEWMIAFIKMLGDDMPALEKDGPDSIMKKIQELSEEFDRYDTDNNKYLEFQEFKKIVENNIYISD